MGTVGTFPEYTAYDYDKPAYWYTTTSTSYPAVVNGGLTNEQLEKIETVASILGLNEKKGDDEVNKDKNVKAACHYKGSNSDYKLMPKIEKVIFNPPATIVIWSDGMKTVVKAKTTGKKKEQDKFSEEYGLAMAIAKRFYITRGEFLKAVENASRPGKGRK